MEFECRFGLAGTAGIQNQGFGKVDTRGHLPDIPLSAMKEVESRGDKRGWWFGKRTANKISSLRGRDDNWRAGI